MTPVLCDAITVCQDLGIRYLWVDCLCIQQDGAAADWEEQSQEMSHIFGNSWLTICAPASRSCLEGFLDHIDRHSRTIQIQFTSNESQRVQGSFRLRLVTLNGRTGFHESSRITIHPPLSRDLESSKWNTRGWVFQERILSPRLLYFGARMIHFQHGNTVISEDGSPINGGILHPSIRVPHYCSANLLDQLEFLQNRRSLITDLWYTLVAAFDEPDFTDARDTFPAIAGIARRVQEFTKQRYIAGLWEEDLFCGLLWNTKDLGGRVTRRPSPVSLWQALEILEEPRYLIAPSWSWARRHSLGHFMITNRINFTCRVRSHLRAEFELVESCVLVDGVNRYGRIGSASISMIGPTIRFPPDSASYRDPNHWICEPFPDQFVILHPDWKVYQHAPYIDIREEMHAQLQLLLIASCCSELRFSSGTQNVHTPPHKDLTEPATEPAREADTDVLSRKKLKWKDIGTKYEEALKPEYRPHFYEDSYDGFDAAIQCDICSNHKLTRDIWGLMIYPAGPVDTYYRVGTFFSRAEHGGSAIFQGVEPRKIELI